MSRTPKPTGKQLEVLAAAADGRLYREHLTHTWWLETLDGRAPAAVTGTGRSLLSADWIRLRPPVNGRAYARTTSRGRQLLETSETPR